MAGEIEYIVRPIAPPMMVQDSADPDQRKYVVHLAGHSSATKPIDVNFATGSDFLEVDTTKVYVYDEQTDDGKWWPAGGESNGGE